MVQARHRNLSSSTIRTCAHDTSVTCEQLQSCIQLDNITTYILQHNLWSTCLHPSTTTMSTLSVFPDEIADLTPELLSSMLFAYSKSSVKVNSFMFEQIGIGKGWDGSIYRLHNIQYSSVSTDCPPPSLVLKLSNGVWLERVASIEPDFYLKFAPRISNIEIPQCHYVARHPRSPNKSILLFEDLSISCVPLCAKESLKDSTLFFLIASIASLHAEFFNHPSLQQDMFAWLPTLNSTLSHYHTAYAQKMADKEYAELLESRISPEAYAYAKALVTRIPHLFQTLTDQHYTLSHGDFWINNVFLRRDQPHRLVLFDWQTCCRANGLIDIAFFLRLLDIDRARSLESQVLELYHQTLVKYGVSHYDASAIREDYYSLALPFIVVLLSSLSFLKDSKFNKILMMLEDIVTYSKKPSETNANVTWTYKKQF